MALDGAAEGTTVTVSLKDKDGAPVAGKVVALTARAGLHPITVAPVSARTDAAGVASFTVDETPPPVRSGSPPSTRPTSLGVGQPVLVSFVDPFTPDPTASRVSVSPTGLVPADGTAFATVTATLLNGAGGPVVGVQADLLPGLLRLVPRPGRARPRSASALTYGLTKTNANGQASFTVSSTQAGTATYTVATSNDVHGTFNYQSSPLSITFGSKAKTTATGLVVDPGTSTAKAAAAVALDGAAEGTTVTVSLKDKDGAPVAGKVVALTARAGLHPITVAPVSARTDAAGVASFTVTDPATGTVGFAAIDETDSLGVGQPVLVSFVDPFTPRPDRLEEGCLSARPGWCPPTGPLLPPSPPRCSMVPGGRSWGMQPLSPSRAPPTRPTTW